MRDQIEKAMLALGYVRDGAGGLAYNHVPGEQFAGKTTGGSVEAYSATEAGAANSDAIYDESGGQIGSAAPVQDTAQQTATEAAASSYNPDARPRGKPGEGRSRRNTAEKVEDDNLEDMARRAGVPLDQLDNVFGQVGSRSQVIAGLEQKIRTKGDAPAETAAISTGDERVGPEDSAETQKQDAADEAAEVEANRKTDAPLTIDDLRGVMGGYVQKFGMPAAQEDGANVFADALGTPPEGEQFWKLTLVGAAGQDVLKKAIDAWKAASAADARYKPKAA